VIKNLKNIIKRAYNKFFSTDEIYTFIDTIIQRKKKTRNPFFFVQIGSNDGKKGDPLNHLVLKYSLSGILVEPVPYIFQRLLNNYKDQKNLIFENSAIGNPGEQLKFYRLKQTPGLPAWHEQLGSFRRDVVMRHQYAIADIEEIILEEDISVISFEELMTKHGVLTVSLLHIDTEGYDFEILKSINFTKYTIENILFENSHLSSEEYEACIKYLKAQGFNKIKKCGGDTICILTM
jgi:FkbM family methyltransferase